MQFNANVYSSIPKKGVSKQIRESVEDPGLTTLHLSACWVLGALDPRWHDMSNSLWNMGWGVSTSSPWKRSTSVAGNVYTAFGAAALPATLPVHT